MGTAGSKEERGKEKEKERRKGESEKERGEGGRQGGQGEKKEKMYNMTLGHSVVLENNEVF